MHEMAFSLQLVAAAFLVPGLLSTATPAQLPQGAMNIARLLSGLAWCN